MLTDLKTVRVSVSKHRKHSATSHLSARLAENEIYTYVCTFKTKFIVYTGMRSEPKLLIARADYY